MAMKVKDSKGETLVEDFPSSDSLIDVGGSIDSREQSRGRIKILSALKCVSPICTMSKKGHSKIEGDTTGDGDLQITMQQNIDDSSIDKQQIGRIDSQDSSFTNGAFIDNEKPLDVDVQPSIENETIILSSYPVFNLAQSSREDKTIENTIGPKSIESSQSLSLSPIKFTHKENFLTEEAEQIFTSDRNLTIMNDDRGARQDSSSILPVNELMERIDRLAQFLNDTDKAAIAEQSDAFEKSGDPITLPETQASLTNGKEVPSISYPFFWRSHPKICNSRKENASNIKNVSPTSVILRHVPQATVIPSTLRRCHGAIYNPNLIDNRPKAENGNKDTCIYQSLVTIEEEIYFPPIPERATSYCSSNEAWTSPSVSRWSSPGRNSWAEMPSITEEKEGSDVTAALPCKKIERIEI